MLTFKDGFVVGLAGGGVTLIIALTGMAIIGKKGGGSRKGRR